MARLSTEYLVLQGKQKEFIDNFISTNDPYESAKLAGYSNPRKSAMVLVDKLRPFIEERTEYVEAQKVADMQEILEFFTSIMRGEETEEIVIYEDGVPQIITKKVGTKDRIKTAEHLAKTKGMFTENRKVESDLQVHFTMDYGEDDGNTRPKLAGDSYQQLEEGDFDVEGD